MGEVFECGERGELRGAEGGPYSNAKRWGVRAGLGRGRGYGMVWLVRKVRGGMEVRGRQGGEVK